MLRSVSKKILSFSAIGAFVIALMMLDTSSPSLVSEAQACDESVWTVCMVNCGYACSSGYIGECLPWQCDCWSYCYAYCNQVSGC